MPEGDATGAAARGTGSDLSRGRAQQALVSADNSRGLQHLNTLGGFDAVWQIDLFGKYRREFAAARAETQAAREARDGVLTAVIDIAGLAVHESLTTYRKTILTAVQQVDTSLDAYRAEEARLDALGTALMAGQRAMELATQRYDRGLTDFLNVVDAERQLYDLQELYAAAQVSAFRRLIRR